METLKDVQQRMLDYIKNFVDERGTSPSVREIGAAVGFKSTSSVQYHLGVLEEKGYISRTGGIKRGISVTSYNTKAYHIPLVGTVTAGAPILATQSIEDYIPLPINAKGRDLFALRIKGDSMINAGILNGDIVVVEKMPVANNGEIVVALIDNEATVKRFYKEDGHFRLQPENDAYEPIIVDELAVLGKVVMVVRNYE